MEIRRAYDLHIAREERELIPLAGALLPPSALMDVSREMAARRGLGTATLPP